MQESWFGVNLQKSFMDEDLHMTFHRLWGVDRLWLNFNFWVDFFFNAEIVLQLGNQLLSTIDPLTTKNVPSTHTLSIHLLMSTDAWSLNSYYIFRPYLLYDLTTLIL